jgi:hypothetical protein
VEVGSTKVGDEVTSNNSGASNVTNPSPTSTQNLNLPLHSDLTAPPAQNSKLYTPHHQASSHGQ